MKLGDHFCIAILGAFQLMPLAVGAQDSSSTIQRLDDWEMRQQQQQIEAQQLQMQQQIEQQRQELEQQRLDMQREAERQRQAALDQQRETQSIRMEQDFQRIELEMKQRELKEENDRQRRNAERANRSRKSVVGLTNCSDPGVKVYADFMRNGGYVVHCSEKPEPTASPRLGEMRPVDVHVDQACFDSCKRGKFSDFECRESCRQ